MGLPSNTNALQNGFAQGYQIGRSLRFRSSASAYLTRTPSTTSDRRIWTASIWAKIGTLGVARNLLSATGVSRVTYIFMNSSNQIGVYSATSAGGGDGGEYTSTQVFRDPSAWYHIVVAYDSTQATSTNRIKVYINGVQITAWSLSTAPTLNHDTQFNWTSAPMQLAAYNTSQFFDGYMAEVNFIDGQQLTPSSFGLYDSNGIWQPIKYTGTYGTNGFYLPFNNTTSTTTLVADASGNGNNWTANNISLTAGTTYDSMIDSPTNSNASSNYATMNPLLYRWAVGAASFSEANLKVTYSGASNAFAFGSIFVTSGKWYFETTVTAIGTNVPAIGVASLDAQNTVLTYNAVYNSDGTHTGSGANYATYTTNDIIGVALDCDGGTVSFYKNNSLQGTVTLTSGTIGLTAFCGLILNSVFAFNFGQRPFTYTPPSGYNALNTANLPQPLISNGANYMAATTYTGNGSTQTINNGTNTAIGTSFQPDFVWIKRRNTAADHALYDSVRTLGVALSTNSTSAEPSVTNGLLTSFNSNGFSVAKVAGDNTTNGLSDSYVGWQWKGGGTAVTNNSGTISSQVSANTSAGFSVVTWTGPTSGTSTVGHGLGVAPDLIITKSRNNVTNWITYHSALGNTKYLLLNGTNAATTASTAWNNTSPTSSVFSCGTDFASSPAYTYVAYCFSAVRGFSAFGSYTGNGSADGPFIYLGFRARWLLLKNTTAASSENWYIYDTTRSTYNVMGQYLYPNATGAENTFTTLDITSNGFKIRTLNSAFNTSSGTYIYAAFAENPFQISRAR